MLNEVTLLFTGKQQRTIGANLKFQESYPRQNLDQNLEFMWLT
jgi:hypothetical protein